MKEKIKVIFENENFLAINKPKNLLVHSDGKSKDFVLVDWILENYPEIEGVGEDLYINENRIIKRPGIVHRLDKDTTGILLIAKHQDAFYHLKELFKNREVEKNYRAFVYGAVKYDQKNIKTIFGRSKNDFRKWTANVNAIRGEEREAETFYKLIYKNENFSYLDIFPKTGRTHQIRVHLQYDDHPIVADHIYAGKRFNRAEPAENLFFTTQALHAYQIKFKDLDGKEYQLTAEVPMEFERALKILKK